MVDPGAGRGGTDDHRHADAQHACRGGAPTPALTYEQALEEVTSRGRFGIKLGTERVAAILAERGHPEAGLRGVLIAGTNGKGSTGAMTAAILQAAGYRVGFMPKPHLQTYRERIQVNGAFIPPEDFAAGFAALQPALDTVARTLGPATEFEILTALAIDYLAPRVDRLVCEVGMGGRLDATNVLDLGQAVVTNVALDHQRHLGATVSAIAAEKAAVIKPGNLALTAATGEGLRVIEAAASAVGAQLWRLGRELKVRAEDCGWAGSRLHVQGPGFDLADLALPLLGSYQPANAALAVAATRGRGDVDDSVVRAGLAGVRWPGRLEVFGEHPRLILDGGHNVAGLQATAAALRRLIGDGRLVVVFGAMGDKDLPGLLRVLRELGPAAVYFTRVADARAAEPSQLARLYGGGNAVGDPETALEDAVAAAGPDGNVLVTGSLYLVGRLRSALLPLGD